MVAYSFQPEFIVPVSLGLGISYAVDDVADVDAGPKRQTIRAVGLRRHARPGDTLQLYTGMRTKKCRLIGKARCISVENICLNVNTGCIILGKIRIHDPAKLTEFARADGFRDWNAMQEFWRRHHRAVVAEGSWSGLLIKWEPIDG